MDVTNYSPDGKKWLHFHLKFGRTNKDFFDGIRLDGRIATVIGYSPILVLSSVETTMHQPRR